MRSAPRHRACRGHVRRQAAVPPERISVDKPAAARCQKRPRRARAVLLKHHGFGDGQRAVLVAEAMGHLHQHQIFSDTDLGDALPPSRRGFFRRVLLIPQIAIPRDKGPSPRRICCSWLSVLSFKRALRCRLFNSPEGSNGAKTKGTRAPDWSCPLPARQLEAKSASSEIGFPPEALGRSSAQGPPRICPGSAQDLPRFASGRDLDL